MGGEVDNRRFSRAYIQTNIVSFTATTNNNQGYEKIIKVARLKVIYIILTLYYNVVSVVK